MFSIPNIVFKVLPKSLFETMAFNKKETEDLVPNSIFFLLDEEGKIMD